MRCYSKTCPHCRGKLSFPSGFYRFIRTVQCDKCTCIFTMIGGRVRPSRHNRCTVKVKS